MLSLTGWTTWAIGALGSVAGGLVLLVLGIIVQTSIEAGEERQSLRERLAYTEARVDALAARVEALESTARDRGIHLRRMPHLRFGTDDGRP